MNPPCVPTIFQKAFSFVGWYIKEGLPNWQVNQVLLRGITSPATKAYRESVMAYGIKLNFVIHILLQEGWIFLYQLKP